MPEFTLTNGKVSLRAADAVGKGGEADIYLKQGSAFKIFKTPNHPDLAGSKDEQAKATVRIQEHQQKLPAFPKGLPGRVIAPEELVRDQKGWIAGYRMQFMPDAEVLLRYGMRAFREQGVSDETVVAVLADLHKTVRAVHDRGVVIGDFNDLNVLVKKREAYLIDADSMQFGPYLTKTFMAKFVDPRICDPALSAPMMAGPHTADTDWYAYVVMLMQSLLYVGPYGGIYRPQDPAKAVLHDARPLKRITVFDPLVQYPKPARHYRILPDDLLHYMEQVFVKDARGMPALPLIESLRFTTCTKCGATHARTVCPECALTTPAALKEVHTGAVKAIKVFAADGVILYAAMQQGILRYLYHEGGSYKREGGTLVVQAPLDPNMRFRVQGSRTLFARGSECLRFGKNERESISVEARGLLPLIDANADRTYYAHSGRLMRTSSNGLDYPERVGDILPNQTLFWVGDELGFGFYRAAELSNFFVFRTAYKGLNDSVKLPAIRGQLIDSTCVFSEKFIWFLTSTNEGGSVINRCFLLDEKGTHLGSAEAASGDGSWLGTIRGKCAAHNFLLASTDDGIVRVALTGSSLEAVKEYPETKRFVDTDSRLFLNREGLSVVGRHDIWRLTLG